MIAYLVTGAAGFIGSHLISKLLAANNKVIGVDNLNNYYDVTLKEMRLKDLIKNPNFIFVRADISDKNHMFELFSKYKPEIVINLAAQAGVRYSIENPDIYIQSNIVGFFNILEACRYYPVKHLIYASSSSVYGANSEVPFRETDFVDNPVSLYATTKKSNELMAYTYSHLYNIPATGLRFFTVYGPMGRPDMAYYKFTDLYFDDKPIHIYNNGDFDNDLYRDFTYVDDVVDGIIKLIDKVPNDVVPHHKVFNIGNNKPVKLMEFIKTLEKCLSKSLNREVEFKKIFESIKHGDVRKTFASTKLLEEEIGFKPKTTIDEGLQKFTDWYVKYYSIR